MATCSLSIGPSDDRPYEKILRFLERAAENQQRIEVTLSTVEGAPLRALTWRGALDVTDIAREIERHLTGSDVSVVANIKKRAGWNHDENQRRDDPERQNVFHVRQSGHSGPADVGPRLWLRASAE